MEKKHTRGSFTGSIGFVLAAAGSAVGLGNIWRFPYLAAKDGGGTFILVYIVLALTFGFTLLTTDIAIGRKTGQSPLVAYGKIHPGWNGLGLLASIVPVVILPYYCSIGGWVLKYLSVFLTGHGTAAAEDGYFTGYITGTWQPIVWLGIYLFLTAFVVYRGVNKGIENYSKILMPILLILIIGISIFSLTLTHTDADGVVRTGLQGMKIYLVPNFKGMTPQKFFTVFVDALGQLFFSISVAMGIMVAYGSYVKKETNLMKSINQIEIFDTIVALLAGLMIVPAVFTFMGSRGYVRRPWSDVCLPAEGLSVHGSSRRRNRNHFLSYGLLCSHYIFRIGHGVHCFLYDRQISHQQKEKHGYCNRLCMSRRYHRMPRLQCALF